MRIQANADTPEEALAGLRAGAAGIGLCRTEPMLLKPSRIQLMRTITTAKDEQGRQAALAALLPLHQGDLEAVFRAAGSVSLTVRLLDPPSCELVPEGYRRSVSLARIFGEHESAEVGGGPRAGTGGF